MIVLDSSAVICLLEVIQPAASAIAALLAASEQIAAVSSMSIVECLTKPLKDTQRKHRDTYQDFFVSRDVKVRDLTPEVAAIAAQLQATFRLKAPDAVHLATALDCQASLFVTTDRHDFHKCVGKVPIRIQIIARNSDT